jgi:hypothetical protein
MPSMIPYIPPAQRNPYTIWYTYANQNLNTYNRIAATYHMERLQFPLNITPSNRF